MVREKISKIFGKRQTSTRIAKMELHRTALYDARKKLSKHNDWVVRFVKTELENRKPHETASAEERKNARKELINWVVENASKFGKHPTKEETNEIIALILQEKTLTQTVEGKQ